MMNKEFWKIKGKISKWNTTGKISKSLEIEIARMFTDPDFDIGKLSKIDAKKVDKYIEEIRSILSA